MSRILFITIILITFTTLHAQNLNDHRWKNRVILILSDKAECEPCQKQLEELNKIPAELIERKLKIYSSIPGQSRINFDQKVESEQNWSKSSTHKRYSKKEHDFEVVLIGLDGGVKLRQHALLTNADLLQKIDAMPMRAGEMRRRNH